MSTLLVAVLVFVTSQLLLQIFLEPLQGLRRTIVRILHGLTYYANFMPLAQCPFVEGATVGNSQDEMKEASREIRKMACDLQSYSRAIPCYGLFAFLRVVPSRRKIEEELRPNIIGWCNSLGQDSSDFRDKIAHALVLTKKARA
jgi:hypothetical protein